MKRYLEGFKDALFSRVDEEPVNIFTLESSKFVGDCLDGWEFDESEMWLRQAEKALDFVIENGWYDFIAPTKEGRWYKEYLLDSKAYQYVQTIAEKELQKLIDRIKYD